MDIPIMMNPIIRIYRFIKKYGLKEGYYVLENFVKGPNNYDNKKDSNNFVVNKRENNHTIMQNGTLINHSIFQITMVRGGDFKAEQWFESENKKYDIDISSIKKYDRLDSNIKENRFIEPILVVELLNSKEGSHFYTENIKPANKRIDYIIKYNHLEIFDSFKFHTILTVPHEFTNRSDYKEELHIKPIYGVYSFKYQIDKQAEDHKAFNPHIDIDIDKKDKEKSELINELVSENADSVFYLGRKWTLYNPKKQVLLVN